MDYLNPFITQWESFLIEGLLAYLLVIHWVLWDGGEGDHPLPKEDVFLHLPLSPPPTTPTPPPPNQKNVAHFNHYCVKGRLHVVELGVCLEVPEGIGFRCENTL